MTYNPDGWAIIKIKGDDPHYRVFGSFAGGYINGDSWKMNSGIVSVTEDDNFYYFDGHSGSIYQCHKKTYGRLTAYNYGVIKSLCERSNNIVEYISTMPTDIMTMNYIIKKN